MECKVVRRRLLVQLVAGVGHSKRSTELLEDTALACSVFRILVDWAGFVEMTPVTSTVLGLGSRFDLDFALHVA
jgi:hypothetical protein